MPNAIIDGLKERISSAVSVNQTVGVILPGNNYSDFIQALFEYMYSKTDSAWVYLAITKPYENIIKDYGDVSTEGNIKFIDCISESSGIYNTYSNCEFIESPAQLEKILLEIMNSFKNIDSKTDKYLIVDSLSSLLIYNNSSLITEFYTHLSNRTKIDNIHCLSLSIEEEMNDNIKKILYLKSDKIIKVRESFI